MLVVICAAFLIFTLQVAPTAAAGDSQAAADGTRRESPAFRVTLAARWQSDPWLEYFEEVARHNASALDQLLPFVSQFDSINAAHRHLETTGALARETAQLINLGVQYRGTLPRVSALLDVYNSTVHAHADLQSCSIFVIIDDKWTCDLDEALAWLSSDHDHGHDTHFDPAIDTAPMGDASAWQKAIVYGHPRHVSFAPFWKRLRKLPVRVALRYVPAASPAVPPRQRLNGYFVHLNIKDLEYKVTDDRTPAGEAATAPDTPTRLESLDAASLETIAARVAHNVTTLDDLARITAAYPVTLPGIAASTAAPSTQLRAKLDANREMAEARLGRADTMLWANGKFLPASSVTIYHLLETLRGEVELAQDAQRIGLPWGQAVSVLQHNVNSEAADYFDTCAIEPVVWLNDLESDPQYKPWPKLLRNLLTATRGMKAIRRNIFTLLFFMDAANPKHVATALEFVTMVENNIPLRFGLVPLVNTDPASKTSRLGVEFWDIYVAKGRDAALQWLASNPVLSSTHPDEAAHAKLLAARHQLAVHDDGEMFFNGRPIDIGESYQHQVMAEYQQQVEQLAMMVYYGQLDDSTDMNKYWCTKPTTWKTRSELAFAKRKPEHRWADFDASALPEDVDLTAQDQYPFVHVTVRGHIRDAALEAIKVAQSTARFALEVVADATTDQGIVINGKLIRHLPAEMTVDDVKTLVHVEWVRRLKQLKLSPTCVAMGPPAFWKASSLWWKNHVAAKKNENGFRSGPGHRMNPLDIVSCDEDKCLTVPASTESAGAAEVPVVQLVALLNPVSTDAQRLVPLLQEVHRALPYVSVTVVWLATPVTKVPDRFTQLVGAGRDAAVFRDLPPILFTLFLDAPHPWVVMAAKSEHDLDNLIVRKNRGGDAEFELKHLLVEGHAVEAPHQSPPRGLQFELRGSAGQVEDTIVMANLGYFQLKASPGQWNLTLRAGRSSNVYEPVQQSVLVDSFLGVTLYPTVHKRAGKEDMSVLDEDRPRQSWWQQVVQSVTGLRKETVHVFSVASGHLYERFLSIMMQSVVDRTQNPVKFWLIEDFLSPSFKATLPALAREFQFEYQLVTYKWPEWLTAQSVKQRTIWGFKILFLDVLFPLNVDKIIFVDADQVVRADLAELVSMDLEGAVYGYTPFCDSRAEMDGFRFWKHGYWLSHLRGKPYHISALYVVDLKRFRQVAAGDILRQQYQGLAQDPNSLANLDQDLPNSLQHMLPIHSLPQEWLWCETWCDDTSLTRAKTIDLCNNPLTKEPKLDRARRLLPEWEVFDERAEKVRHNVLLELATKLRPDHDEL
ncbi:hypothetical protein GGF32_001492 [Allomyces javanicus]|nr:hypothetical protein GGF32_001492 [Allomyces javanicus]